MNNAQASHLSSADYGYDFVVATTQQGINATMKRFMATLDAPLISRCYKPDPDPARRGTMIEVSHDEIMKMAKTDPFDIPDGTPLDEVRDKLNNCQFVEGWRARIGIDKSAIPTMGNVVELTTSMETVQFNMYCKEFQVAGWVRGAEPWDDSIWLNVSQPKKAPWKITSRVNLTQQTVDWKVQGDNVPHDVMKALQNLEKESPESVFTVEHLLLDLSRTELTATRPTLDGLEQNTALYTMLMGTFLGPYFDEMRKLKQPLLSSTIKRNAKGATQTASDVHLTDFRYGISPYKDAKGNVINEPALDQQNAATIDYLCMAKGNKLPIGRAPFTWNWMDVSELKKYHGIISLKRNQLVDHMIPLLKTHILPNCFEPKPEWRTFDIHKTISWKFDPAASTPTITTAPDGTVVLTLQFQSGEYTDRNWNHLNGVSAKTSSSINVSFTGKAISISQHYVFWVHIWESALPEELSGNLADWTLNSTYDIAVNAEGKLEVRPPKTDPLIDSSLVLTGSGYSAVATIIKRDVSDQVKLQVAPLEPIPVTFAQNFVFPGGNTFIFKDPGFSAYQDLVSHITYADP